MRRVVSDQPPAVRSVLPPSRPRCRRWAKAGRAKGATASSAAATAARRLEGKGRGGMDRGPLYYPTPHTPNRNAEAVARQSLADDPRPVDQRQQGAQRGDREDPPDHLVIGVLQGR